MSENKFLMYKTIILVRRTSKKCGDTKMSMKQVIFKALGLVAAILLPTQCCAKRARKGKDSTR